MGAERREGFTPGPWVCAVDKFGFAEILKTGREHPIADIASTAGTPFGPEEEANALLIAAAPEMFAALVNLLIDDGQDELEDPCGHAERGGWRRINESVLKQAAAALAKARGSHR